MYNIKEILIAMFGRVPDEFPADLDLQTDRQLLEDCWKLDSRDRKS